MPGRRSNYTLLSQTPDEPFYHQPPPQQPKLSAGGGGGPVCNSSRAGSGRRRRFPGSFGLQRQSSGSSFGESSISGDYYVPSLSNPEVPASHLSDGGGEFRAKTAEVSISGGGSSSSKSWAQQTEESYQLQLALALRLSSEATCADDPNFLDPVPEDSASIASSSPASASSFSSILGKWLPIDFDKVPDGFYMIHGMDPYVWAVCSDHQESGRIPPLDTLKAVDPAILSSVEVISVDRRADPSLKELQNRVHNLSSSCITTKEIVDQLAKLVCNHMGFQREDGLVTIWKECSDDLKDCLGSIVVPIGSLSIGLCRHRTLLFKVLADIIGLPCRIARGCKCCTREDASSCLVRFGLDREYLIDLVEKPGCLCEPDSLLNGPSTISISSPLRFPRFRKVEPAIDFRLLAKQFFADFQSLNLEFDDSLAESCSCGHMRASKSGINLQTFEVDCCAVYLIQQNLSVYHENPELHTGNVSCFHDLTVHSDVTWIGINFVPFWFVGLNLGVKQLLVVTAGTVMDGGDIGNSMFPKQSEELMWIEPALHPAQAIERKFQHTSISHKFLDKGSFGTVHRAEWNGCDVAVKILMEQDFHAERFKEFIRGNYEKTRHPNIVLFMGAVTEPPNLSIVTEYLSRGSLYRLLHKPGAKEALDERRRLSMAYDVVGKRGYLQHAFAPCRRADEVDMHFVKAILRLKTLIANPDSAILDKINDNQICRDLLIVSNTFLSSKSAAGTPEWMAPEVLRDEPSNEKSDVYSFGVILWELATLQQPWGNLNPAQVVAAVGFKGKRLEIPRDVNPHVAAIIEACWAKEPWKRPSFSSIMDSLRQLIKSSPPTQPGKNTARIMCPCT
ncbi:hypothetical protein DH2020_018055 [Rehmannia glutinosa]|uniref:Protein kinase domain-containing protein n=1 Tax=Rehmannia glutinosa TaxID=99300 RepID=A0ABR0WHT0_REHGL